MRISELATRSGLSVDTLRFYEKKGLIDSTLIQRQRNNYRDYADATLERIMLIRQGKQLGFTLAEIQTLIHEFEADRITEDRKRTIIHQKIQQIDEKISEFQAMKQYLLAKLDHL